MSYCDGKILQGLAQVDCANPPVKGFERRGVIINRSDIDFAAATFGTAKNVLTSLPLKSGATGYEIQQKGATPFSGSKSSAEVGTYATGISNDIVFAVLNNNGDISDKFSDGLLNGEFVVVLEMKDKGPDNKYAFRVYGFHNGLSLSAYEHDPNGDTFAGALITLHEDAAPLTALYLGESYTEGKKAFEALINKPAA